MALAESIIEVLDSSDLFSAVCGECGSKNLTWYCDTQKHKGVQDGLLRMNEIVVLAYLGCDECSETVRIVEGSKIAELLTRVQAEILSDRVE